MGTRLPAALFEYRVLGIVSYPHGWRVFNFLFGQRDEYVGKDFSGNTVDYAQALAELKTTGPAEYEDWQQMLRRLLQQHKDELSKAGAEPNMITLGDVVYLYQEELVSCFDLPQSSVEHLVDLTKEKVGNDKPPLQVTISCALMFD